MVHRQSWWKIGAEVECGVSAPPSGVAGRSLFLAVRGGGSVRSGQRGGLWRL